MIEKAKWIWGDFDEEVNQYVDFIMDFEVDDVDENAYFEISVDKEYVAYINGKFVGCGQFHDYPDRKVYDSYKIKEYLNKGKNRLFVTGNYQGSSSMQYAKGERAICFAIKNHDDVFLSNKNVLSAKSKSYMSGEIYKLTGQLGYGAIVTGVDEPKTIDEIPGAEFSTSVEKNVATTLVKRPIKKLEIGKKIPVKVIAQGIFLRKETEGSAAELMQRDFLSSRYFDELFEGDDMLTSGIVCKKYEGDGVYVVIDMGREESGYFTLDIDAKKDTRIDIAYGEHLEDLRVRSFVGGRNFAYTYYTKSGRRQFTHYFKRIAGRYLQLHIQNSGEFKLYYAGMYPAKYPVTQKGYFECEDSLHNKIYEVSVETLRQCMHEHYEDCPWREQALYSSDSRNQALCGYYVFDNPEFARSSIELLGRSFSDDGYLKICSPTDDSLKIPSFSLLWLLELKEYTEYTGDVTLAEEMWKTVDRMIEMQMKNMQNGIVKTPVGKDYWNFYEWSDGYMGFIGEIEKENYRLDNDFADGIFQVVLYIAIKSAVQMSEILNRTAFASKYSEVLKQMKKTINQRFYDKEKGLYASYVMGDKPLHFGELMQVMTVYSGISEGEDAKRLREIICKSELENKITISYSIYKYDALMQEADKYKEYVFNEIKNRWGNMLFKGATTFWETDNGADDFEKAGSLCHGWSAIPVYFYYRYALGITAENLIGKSQETTPVDGIFMKTSGYVKMTEK